MDLTSEMETIDIFIESASELMTSKFLEQATREGIRWKMTSKKGQGISFDRTGPENEAVKATILTIRFFCQDNESSIGNVATIVSGLPIDRSLHKEFLDLRDSLNSFLDSAPQIPFPDSEGAGTNRIIFETFVYGRFAHANRLKRRKLREWSSRFWYTDLRSQFDVVLVEFIRHVSEMSEVCQKIRNALAT